MGDVMIMLTIDQTRVNKSNYFISVPSKKESEIGFCVKMHFFMKQGRVTTKNVDMIENNSG